MYATLESLRQPFYNRYIPLQYSSAYPGMSKGDETDMMFQQQRPLREPITSAPPNIRREGRQQTLESIPFVKFKNNKKNINKIYY